MNFESPKPDEYFEPIKPLTDSPEEIPQQSETTPETIKPIDATYDGFGKSFNIDKEELEKIEEFKNLTDGQKELALKNLEQVTLSDVQKQAIEKYQKEREEVGFWGRSSMGIFKRFYMSGSEKETAKETSEGGIEKHKDVISEISKNIKESGLDGHWEGKKFKIDYAGNPEDLKNLTEEEKAQVRDFNVLADKMVNAKNEWVYGKKDRGFEKIKEKYEAARGDLLSLKKKELGEDGKATLATAEIDRRVYMNQWLNTSSKAAKELEQMKSQWVWLRATRNTLFEKGGYTAMGYVGRTYAIGILGFLAAPLTAAAMGGWMGRKRAIENIKEEMKVTTQGGEHKLSRKVNVEIHDEEKKETVKGKKNIELLNVVDSKALAKNINRLEGQIKEVEAEASGNMDKEKKTREERLANLNMLMNSRLMYTKMKIDQGLVNFGEGKEKLQNQYNLLEKFTKADVEYNLNQPQVKTAIDARLEQFLGYKSGKVDKYISNQMLKGMAMGTGCALLGTAIRELFHGNQPVHRNLLEDLRGVKDYFGRFFGDDATKANLPYASAEKSAEMAKAAGMEGSSKDTTAAQVVIESKNLNVSKDTTAVLQTAAESKAVASAEKGAVKAAEKIQEHVATIKKGGSLWSAARELVKQKVITEKQFREMWSSEHSKFFTSSNVDAHISRMDLVHEGDHLTAVMGGKGIPPHFELVEKTPGTAGTDQDLYDYYLAKTSKTPPEWLRKQVWGEDYIAHHGGAGSHVVDEASKQPGTGYKNIDEALEEPGTGYKNIDEALEEPGTGYKNVDEALGLKSKLPPPIEHAVPGKGGSIIEQIKPGEIRIKGENMQGVIRFNYDNPNHILNLDETHFKDLSGNEVLKDDHLGILREKTITEHMPNRIPQLYNNMEVDGLEFYKYLKVYESISNNPAYAKETSYVASAIKYMIKEMTQKYGDVVDQKALPEIFRQAQ